MLKQAAGTLRTNRVADAAFAASRQVWLAGLGAAIVTRKWARDDAGHVFRALVKEGAGVETRAIRVLGRRIESSIVVATTAWNRARDAAQATVNGLVESTAAALPRFNARVAGRHAAKPAAKKRRLAAKRATSRKSRRNRRSA
jgi:hypothetical protein